MVDQSAGQVAVIFVSRRNESDAEGYALAAQQMTDLAQQQPGFLGMDSARDVDRTGITVSYWETEAAAKSWRDHPDHVRIRESGRDLWYDSYCVTVAQVSRRYDWQRS